MKTRGVPILILILVLVSAGAAWSQTGPFDIQVSAGGWSLSPFRPLVETECERLIRNGFSGSVGSVLALISLTPLDAAVNLGTSSGYFFGGTLWYRFENRSWAVGLEADYFDFRVPYTVAAATTVDVLGIPLATVRGNGQGTTSLRGVALSFLGRWTLLSAGPVELSIRGGLMAMPFQGDFALNQTTVVTTAIGDIRLPATINQTIDDIRALGFDIPSLILAPVLGIDVRVRIAPRLALVLGAQAAQGTFFSGGLVFTL
jgi:hypothetical protein